ncbi:hypothetical protein PG994_001153 [Apiospora phragmitis]|uniref:Uncharacterized protein n=1 Tax=Apiospora phragmitis TaxID=2905665 RepID=A0ABR1WSQ9_9PEZI
MARTKQTAKLYGKGIITWTRFHLPLEQEWPIWSVTMRMCMSAPLRMWKVFRRRWAEMVGNPAQAAYIIVWRTLDDLKNFKSSPACVEFLQNLPENDNVLQVSIESGSALRYLTLDSASSSTSRFLAFEHIDGHPTAAVEGRVTFTAFLVPQNDNSMRWMWYDSVKDVFGHFLPRGSDWQYLTVWFWVLTEDHWVESKFGKLEKTHEDLQEDPQGRTIICEFRLWPHSWGVTPEHEEASATDSQARESWGQAVAQVMPPVTAWEQERWDIREVPRFYPPPPKSGIRRTLSWNKS